MDELEERQQILQRQIAQLQQQLQLMQVFLGAATTLLETLTREVIALRRTGRR